jgi:hypothetical protein
VAGGGAPAWRRISDLRSTFAPANAAYDPDMPWTTVVGVVADMRTSVPEMRLISSVSGGERWGENERLGTVRKFGSTKRFVFAGLEWRKEWDSFRTISLPSTV